MTSRINIRLSSCGRFSYSVRSLYRGRRRTVPSGLLRNNCVGIARDQGGGRHRGETVNGFDNSVWPSKRDLMAGQVKDCQLRMRQNVVQAMCIVIMRDNEVRVSSHSRDRNSALVVVRS